MHPFSVLTLGIFVAGYITARWDLVTRLYELAIFAHDHDVLTRTLKGFTILSFCFFIFIIPIERLAARETDQVRLKPRTSLIFLTCASILDDMVKNNGLLRVFWPLDSIVPNISGVFVGWRNSEADIVIASVLENTQLRVVDNALRVGGLFRGSPHPVEQILENCGDAQLQVLGTVNAKERAPPSSGILVASVGPSTYPHIELPDTVGLDCQIIMFKRPDPTRMQYMSLEPMTLSLAGQYEKEILDQRPLDDVESAERFEKKRVEELAEKVKLHTVMRFPPTRKDLALPLIISQMNCCYEINALLQKNIGLVRARAKRTLSVSERVVESAADLWDYTHYGLAWFWWEFVHPVITEAFIRGLIAHRIIGELILVVAGWRVPLFDGAVRDVSATVQQVDLRLQQFCYWPIQYLTLREGRDKWDSITTNHTEYIRYYNSLWLVANDVIMGIAVGSFIIENADFVASQLDALVAAWSISGLQRVITWLMDNPAGLKLNNELADFFGNQLFLWVIEYWSNCVDTLRPSLPHVIRFIGFASFAGASMPLALSSDFISLFTLHIHCFYIASARIYNWQLSIIVSLFHLFRGKKRNILRNRIDSCDYELDQLLLGTILFTLLTFLLPTVAVFYFACALARSGIIFIKAILDTALAALNHFPLFALMLRMKDSGRLPGGILFELHDTPAVSRKGAAFNTSYITMKSTPLSLHSIFHEYFQFGNRIRKHYLSPKVFFGFASGTFVPPLHRKNLYGLQYSMLPAKRVGIVELWDRLKTTATKSQKVNGVANVGPLPAGSGLQRRGLPSGYGGRRSHY